MAARLALVVDDSNTARVTLKRMLERQGLDVDTLESARDGLDYLIHKTPDVIFMDHMMPDMDGFEAVEAIKSNPDTATIPIMMYTSKGGDLYVSQARALGAVGILPKQVQPAELFEVLNNLGLVRERRTRKSATANSFTLMEPVPEIAAKADSEDMREIARQAAISVSHGGNLQAHIGELLESNIHDLRLEIRELRDRLYQLSETGTASPSSSRTRMYTGLLIPLVVLLVLLIPLLWLFHLNNEKQLALNAAGDQITRMETQQQQQIAAANDESTSLRALLDSEQDRTDGQSEQLFKSLAWAVNLSSAYDVNEEAFSDRRLAIVYELVTRLHALGFRGVVQLDSHLGEFCLAGDDVEGYTLAPPDLPVTECVLLGHPLQQLPLLGERQSIAFANFLATSPLVNEGDISIEIVSHQYSQPLVNYPLRDSSMTAYEWNRIASANNRVEVALLPDTE
jgi:CheY-like chemotaxis protein